MEVTKEFTYAFQRSTLSIDAKGIAHIKVTGVVTALTGFRAWLFDRCEALRASGCVIDFRRACMAVNWADYMGDPSDLEPTGRLIPIAMVVNPALLDDMKDWTWTRAKQGHMRAVFADPISATTWAADRRWPDQL